MVRDVMDLDVYGRERAALPGAGPRGTRGAVAESLLVVCPCACASVRPCALVCLRLCLCLPCPVPFCPRAVLIDEDTLPSTGGFKACMADHSKPTLDAAFSYISNRGARYPFSERTETPPSPPWHLRPKHISPYCPDRLRCCFAHCWHSFG